MKRDEGTTQNEIRVLIDPLLKFMALRRVINFWRVIKILLGIVYFAGESCFLLLGAYFSTLISKFIKTNFKRELFETHKSYVDNI